MKGVFNKNPPKPKYDQFWDIGIILDLGTISFLHRVKFIVTYSQTSHVIGPIPDVTGLRSSLH